VDEDNLGRTVLDELHRCCRKRLGEYLCDMLAKLLVEREAFFDKREVLNSEGRKVLRIIARQIMERDPSLERMVKNAWREPTLANILKLASVIAANCLAG
jgi:hypothetical protein